jgi:FkbM family methyltransferase
MPKVFTSEKQKIGEIGENIAVKFLMKHIGNSKFGNLTYNIVVMDEESIIDVPGIDTTLVSAKNHAYATHASFYDEHEVRDRHWHFNSDNVVMDVGAAFGSYTITAALQGANVYSFEPCLFCRSILQENISANPEISNKINVIEFGLHEKTGWFDPNANTFHDEEINGSCLKVVSLDDMNLEMNNKINMIKIDVEGGELSVLQGAIKVIKKYLPRLLIEEHEFKVPGIGLQCEKFLQSIGYQEPIRFPHHDVNHAYYESPLSK